MLMFTASPVRNLRLITFGSKFTQSNPPLRTQALFGCRSEEQREFKVPAKLQKGLSSDSAPLVEHGAQRSSSGSQVSLLVIIGESLPGTMDLPLVIYINETARSRCRRQASRAVYSRSEISWAERLILPPRNPQSSEGAPPEAKEELAELCLFSPQ